MSSFIVAVATTLGLVGWAMTAVVAEDWPSASRLLAQGPRSAAARAARSGALDNTPPTLTHNAPTNHSGPPLVSIDVTLSDDVELGFYAVTDAQVAANNRVTILPPGSASASFTLQRPLVAGPNTLLLMAVDAAGNVARAVLSIVYTPGGGGEGGLTPPPGGVVITEIMPNPNVLPDTQGEWFEVHNPGSATYDLVGCAIARSGGISHIIASSVTLAPGAFVTFASSASPGFLPTYVYSGIALLNTNDQLTLACGDATIDAISYTGPTAGESRSLDPSSFDAVQNDDESNWCDGTASYNGDLGTPGALNPSCP